MENKEEQEFKCDGCERISNIKRYKTILEGCETWLCPDCYEALKYKGEIQW